MITLMERARAVALDARVLLDAGRAHGAVSRAYYPMFCAARAALAAVDAEFDRAKTHATALRRFSRHVVVEQGLARELERGFRKVFDLRLAADYDGPEISIAETRSTIEFTERFLEAMASFIEGLRQ